MRRRGPYKQYLEPLSTATMSQQTKRRREEEVRRRNELIAAHRNDEPNANGDNAELEVEILEPDDNNDNQHLQQLVEPLLNPMPSVVLLPDVGESDDRDDERTFHFGDYNETVDDNEVNIEGKIENDDELSHSFTHLLQYLQNNNGITNFTVKFNVGEILLMVLTLSLIHNLSLSCMCDIMALLNVMFNTKLFPATPYLFKKYLNPGRKMVVHYVCERCGDYLGSKTDVDVERINVENNNMTCNNCACVNILKGYRYDCSFVTLDVASQINDILIDPKCKFNFNIDADRENDTFDDITSGLMYKRKVPKSTGNTRFITCTFNIDGSPISKDAKTSITPIFLMLNELDYTIRSKNLILAGLWYGKEKPRMDIFLNQFTKQMNDLEENGINVTYKNEKLLLKVIPLCCCVDTIARAQVQGIKSVNGYYCCSWCQIKGKNILDSQIKYPSEDPQPAVRTEAKFLRSCDLLVKGESDIDTLKGVNSVSPLLELTYFSIIWGFCPDIMHLGFLGISFRFMEIWLSDCRFEGYIGTPTLIKSMDKIIGALKVPQYLKRLPVKLTLRRVMKSRELENWLLFYSVPCVKGFLPRKFYRHWKLFVKAVRILLQDQINIQEVDHAETLLFEFVYKTEEYYGQYEMTYNMHQLLHLAESVRRWGPLWAHTAYPFEASLGNLKSVIKAATGVPHQIFRNIEINQACNIIINHSSISDDVFIRCDRIQGNEAKNFVRTNNDGILLGKSLPFFDNALGLVANAEEYKSYSRYLKSGIVLSTKFVADSNMKTDNSFVECHDGTFGQIQNFLCSSNDPKNCKVVIEKLVCEDDDMLQHTKIVVGRGRTALYNIEEVKCVAVHIFVDEYNEYISSIPIKHFALNL